MGCHYELQGFFFEHDPSAVRLPSQIPTAATNGSHEKPAAEP